VVSFTPRPLYSQGKSPWCKLDRKLGGPQNRSGRHGEEKSPDPTGDSNSDPSVIQPVASRYTYYAIPAPLSAVFHANCGEGKVNLSILCAMKTYGGVEISSLFLTWALAADEWSTSCPCRFTSGQIVPANYSIPQKLIVVRLCKLTSQFESWFFLEH
jgi:hypothetical protein